MAAMYLDSMVEVDLIILSQGEKTMKVKMDEGANPITIPKHGVRVLSRDQNNYGVISLSERRAIEYGLI